MKFSSNNPRHLKPPKPLATSVTKDTTTINRRLKTRKKETILTGEHEYKDNTIFGQQVSRHSLLIPVCFNFFPTAQNILKYLPANCIFGFARQTGRPIAKAKEPFFANAFFISWQIPLFSFITMQLQLNK